jgi:hypothetical protein
VTLEARRSSLLLPLLLLLLLLLVSLGVITPRWWWWRRDRRTDVPLRAVGLGAGLLGPTCSPLALLWGFETSDSSARCSLRRLSSSDPPPELPRAEPLLAAPLPLSKGLGATAGLALGATPVGWGPPAGASKIWIPRRGSWSPVWQTATPLSSRVGNVARIAVLRPGSSQSVGMAWGSIRDSGTKVSPVTPPPPPGVLACPRIDRCPARAGSY